MTQIKKPLSNLEKTRELAEEGSALSCIDIERLLLPRLKFMGHLFFCMSAASLVFAFFVHGENAPKHVSFTLNENENENSILTDIEKLSGASLFKDMQPLEIPPHEVFNFYAVSGIFASIGAAIYFISTKKQKKIQDLS